MAQRAVLISGVVLVGLVLGALTPWSHALPSCSGVPAAERETERLAGRCAGPAPIVSVSPGSSRTDGAAPIAEVARRPVPDLRGRPFNRDDERLARYIVAIDYRESAQRRDWVIDQLPRPPAAVPDGAGLRVVLSDGGLVRVPDVRGSFARALTILYRAGLSWSSGDQTAGSVVGQVPAAGASVRPGTEVVLRVAPGPLALAPESTRPQVGPQGAPPSSAPAPTPAPAPSTAPSAPADASTPSAPAPRTAPATTMPDVHGMIFDAARVRLSGFDVERVHRAGTEPGGTVIGQTPTAGAPLAPGTKVRLVLSDGSLVRVPRVNSFPLSEARQRLVRGDLQPVIANVANEAPAGTVVSQQPAEGQIVARGSAIRLNVSSGPAAAPLALPNLVGTPLERAQAQLGRFKVERSERAAREPAGTILEQDPPPGTRVEPGSTVAITVSSGGRPEGMEVPRVVGQNVDAATSTLSEFRLERETVPSLEPAGSVLAQEPAPGASVAPGSTVRLRVSDGSLVRVPSFADMTLTQARQAATSFGLRVAIAEGPDEANAVVVRQQPAPGAEAARGSELRLVVEDRSPLAAALSSVRDGGIRARAYVAQLPPRLLAVALIVLLALVALALLTRRTRRAWSPPVEPVFAPADAPRPPPRERAVAPASRSPAYVATPATGPRTMPPQPLPPAAAPPHVMRRGRTRKAAPDVAPVIVPAAEPATIAARARLEADPDATRAVAAAPRGPEIRIAARLERGRDSVRELPETARDELTEEAK